MPSDSDNEITRLKKALNFLTSHLPGATELAELAEFETVTLESNHIVDAETILVGNQQNISAAEKAQKALDEFKVRKLSKLEVGRLYERYIGYLYEEEDWTVTFKGIVDGFDDLGRDLICVRGDEHLIVQAKCWSKHKIIHERHVYQLHASTLHYRMSLRKTLREAYGQRIAKEMMKPINKNLKSVICTTTELSDTADEVVEYLGKAMEHRREPLVKNYPMIKCNVSKKNGSRLYHLPFDPAYDTIIIGNNEGEEYVETVAEAETLGFKRVGT